VVGRVADHVGRRRTFAAGLVVFAIGSTACAMAPGLGWLLAARALQGVGGAVVAPLALGTTSRMLPEDRRSWAVGVLAAGGTSFLVLGPLLGGALVDLIGWRALFAVPVPIALVLAVLVRRVVSASREPRPRPIDVPAAVLLVVGLVALLGGGIAVVQVGAPAFALSALGALLLVAHVRRDARRPAPLLEPQMLRIRALWTPLAALFAIQFAVFGVTVSLALYLQRGLGWSAVAAGAAVAVAGLGTPLLSVPVGRRADSAGARRFVVPGLALGAVALGLVAVLAPWGVAVAAVGLLLFAVARPLVFTPASAAALTAGGPERRAYAASLATVARQFGAVLGVAMTTLVLTAPGGPVLFGEFRTAVLASGVVVAGAAVAVGLWMPRTPGAVTRSPS
jgi:MFS transporter, DHA2 family, methylenomycin A resistance protein